MPEGESSTESMLSSGIKVKAGTATGSTAGIDKVEMKSLMMESTSDNTINLRYPILIQTMWNAWQQAQREEEKTVVIIRPRSQHAKQGEIVVHHIKHLLHLDTT